MNARDWLHQAWRTGRVEPLDVMLAERLHALGGDADETVLWLVALLAYQHRQGHVCLDLRHPPSAPFDTRDCPWQVPDLAAIGKLDSAVLGGVDSDAPVVLDGPRLYLRRHLLAEQRVAAALLARCAPRQAAADIPAALADEVFPEGSDPWQKAAAINCALHRFGVITGGPGTGKTWTVTRMLVLRLKLAARSGGPLPRIALAAPTGKAAARLSESVQAALPGLPLDEALRASLPREGATLHRLLGMGTDGRARFHAENPLPWDLVVVDEASMVDMGLMARLVDALPDDASLCLVGDRDQLASVQAGSVFADVCGEASNRFSATVARRLADAGVQGLDVDVAAEGLDSHVTRLRHVHRFGGESGIGRLAEAVRTGAAQDVLALRERGSDDLAWYDADPEQVADFMLGRYRSGVAAALEGVAPAELLSRATDFRCLSATRRGSLGSEELNRRLESRLRREFGLGTDTWFPGKLVLLRHNDWNLRLFNGDLGLTVTDPESGEIRVAFAGADGDVRLVPPARLPTHEPAWTMTIHKSQGSEFEQVLLVLPPEDSPLLTRELLYTGITRARSTLALVADAASLHACVGRPVWRASGLHDRLRPGRAHDKH